MQTLENVSINTSSGIVDESVFSFLEVGTTAHINRYALEVSEIHGNVTDAA